MSPAPRQPPPKRRAPLRQSTARRAPPPFTTVLSTARPALRHPEGGCLCPTGERPALSPPLTLPPRPRDLGGVTPQPQNREISENSPPPARWAWTYAPPPPPPYIVDRAMGSLCFFLLQLAIFLESNYSSD